MLDTSTHSNCNINKQELHGNSTAINAGTYNNNIIFDDPFSYYCNLTLKKHPELSNKLKLIELFIEKDNLKKRFLGMRFKYELLMQSLTIESLELIDVVSSLDDGYKSVISCILSITNYFEYNPDKDYFNIIGNGNILAKISSNGLEISYSNSIELYKEYLEANALAENIIEKITPYILCATTYGNFLQFGNTFIKKLDNVPFIPQKINFRVSNNIIPNLIKPLYGDKPECGLRELIQNSCDATKQLNDIDTSHNFIELEINSDDVQTTLTIRDYGIGMTEDILLNKFFVVGESTKKDNTKNLLGQFGIGALSAFLLGDNISVKTKSHLSEKLYSFEYNLTSNENNPIAVSLKNDENFKCGTEIKIILNNTLHTYDKQKLEKSLKINEWYILPDVEIRYTFNDEPQKIECLNTDEYAWTELSSNPCIKYLEIFPTNFSSLPKVIYNGIIVQEPYEFRSKYIRLKPYISISSSDDSLKLNLERNKFVYGLDKFINPIEYDIISKGFDSFNEDNNIIVDTNKNILLTHNYNNTFLKDLPLFFTKNGFGIFNSNIPLENCFVIYGYNSISKISLDDLDADKTYIFSNCDLNKSYLSSLIENANCDYFKYINIDNNLIKKYFYDANNSHYGFKLSTMKILYSKFFKKDIHNFKKSQPFWDYHNSIKKINFDQFFKSNYAVHICKQDFDSTSLDNLKLKINASVICNFNIFHHDRLNCEVINAYISKNNNFKYQFSL